MLFIEALLITIFYIRNKGDAFTPAFIAMAMFFIATLCIVFNKELWSVTYSSNTFVIVVSGFLSIFFADLCAKFLSGYKFKSNHKGKISVPDSLEIPQNISCVITVVMILGLIEQGLELYRMKGLLDSVAFLNLIGMVKESDLNFTVIGKLFYQTNNILMSICLFVFAYNCGTVKKNKGTILYLLPSAVGFFNLVITGSRSILYRAIFIFIITYVISYRQHKSVTAAKATKILIKRIMIPMIVITVFFYALRTVTKASTASGSRTFIEYITYYIGSPLYIFNKYILDPTSVTNGSDYFGGLTFAGFYNSLFNFGFINKPVQDLNFVHVGALNNDYYVGGNEYSLFMRPYDDFGIVGMLIFIFILFFVFSYVYYHTLFKENGSNKFFWTLLIYSYFFYIIVMSFYYPFTVQESKIMNLVYMLIMVIAFKIIVHRKYYRENKYNLI